MTEYYSDKERVILSSIVETGIVTYVWEKNGVIIPGETGKDYIIESFSKDDIGDYEVIATVGGQPLDTVFAVGHVELVTTPQKFQEVDLIEGEPFSSEITSEIIFVPTATPEEKDKYSAVYQWMKDGQILVGSRSNKYEVNNSTVFDSGDYSVTTGLYYQEGDVTDLTEVKSTRMIKVSVSHKSGYMKWKVIPLPYRGSSFTWVGYWVIDEIKKNPNWFTDQSSMKYKDEATTLVNAFGIYGDVDVMESRNGRILKVSDLK